MCRRGNCLVLLLVILPQPVCGKKPPSIPGTDSVYAAIEGGLDILEDGSWLVKTRSKPVQTFFDNGGPHEESQFISIAATGWAVAAHAKSLD